MNNIPTLSQIFTNTVASIETALNVTIPTFGKSFLRTFSQVTSGKLRLNYVLLGKIQKNVWVDTAESETQGGTLERFGRIKIGRGPFEAKPGYYTISVTGDIGVVIPAFTTFKSDDTSRSPGKLYMVDTDFTLTASPDFLQVRALVAGTSASLNVNDTLTITAPIALLDNAAICEAIDIAPLSAESIDAYRAIVIESFQSEPQGGAAIDYRLWSRDADGVKQAYPYRNLTEENEIDVYIEQVAVDSVDGHGQAQPSLLVDVANVIELDPDVSLDMELRGRRPLGVFQVNTLSVITLPVDLVIHGTFTNEEKTIITAAVTAFVDTVRPFVSGADILDERNDRLTTSNITAIVLMSLPYANITSVDMEVNSISEITHTFTRGDIPYVNTITYAV